MRARTSFEMTNVFALNRVLPPISIETDCLARIVGTQAGNKLDMLVPPAGWLEPAVSVADMLTFALIEAGHGPAEAKSIATVWEDTLLATLPAERRPVMLDYAGIHACASVSDVARVLADLGQREAEAAAALSRLSDEAACSTRFTYGELGNSTRSLRDLGSEPLQSGLTEFWPGIGSNVAWLLAEDDRPAEGKMLAWMEMMRPTIEALEATVGTRLFYFKEPDDDLDDDQAHRFLALDYVCHMIPDSSFVRYLVEASGAPSVEALRASLLAPASYSPDFRLFDSFHGPEVSSQQEFMMPLAPGC